MGVRPEDVELASIPFWVQIHGLPTMFASQDFIAKIGDHVGEFITADPFNFGGTWKSYYRIRVKMNITSPLKRRMKLTRRDGSVQWIMFKYERLSTFCYCCGILGHSDKFCKTVYEEGILPEAFPFGPPPTVLVDAEEVGGLQGDLKRRRGEEEDTTTGSDVQMTDTPRNHEQAGLADQARQDK
ncbi:PREDICTED: uncharacterized protein At4g02000-like [Ipomoea nil]|uniref:uncharacterized protein At4g02000-like n=1 Tax=Ipomoea nil TaxID=35883 RepID=UPI000901D185|nr:PREDICTED: uncharacterized protein At4g02000-like [Ipomoea nil]